MSDAVREAQPKTPGNLSVECQVCKEGLETAPSSFGRAIMPAWKDRHRHPAVEADDAAGPPAPKETP